MRALLIMIPLIFIQTDSLIKEVVQFPGSKELQYVSPQFKFKHTVAKDSLVCQFYYIIDNKGQEVGYSIAGDFIPANKPAVTKDKSTWQYKAFYSCGRIDSAPKKALLENVYNTVYYELTFTPSQVREISKEKKLLAITFRGLKFELPLRLMEDFGRFYHEVEKRIGR